MFAGVVDKGGIKKSLLANRAEYAIIGTIFILAHGIHYLVSSVEFSYLFDGPLYFYIGIVALFIAIPLFITSFMWIRKRINGKSWKKLHKMSRLFYALIGLHLILLQNNRMYFYIAIFALYFIMKFWTMLEQKLKKVPKPLAYEYMKVIINV
jgi:DMSO/TMAO reductase YedYZ heme-binding membrane subunit